MSAERIKQLRKQMGYTQVAFADTLGVSVSTIAMWETGKRYPSFKHLNEMSSLFDRSVDYILGKSDDASSQKFSDEDIEQLGKWDVEDRFRETILAYLSLDSYGKSAVESLIKDERLRCHDQATLTDTSNIAVGIRIK